MVQLLRSCVHTLILKITRQLVIIIVVMCSLVLFTEIILMTRSERRVHYIITDSDEERRREKSHIKYTKKRALHLPFEYILLGF